MPCICYIEASTADLKGKGRTGERTAKERQEKCKRETVEKNTENRESFFLAFLCYCEEGEKRAEKERQEKTQERREKIKEETEAKQGERKEAFL